MIEGKNCPDLRIGHNCHTAGQKIAGYVVIAGMRNAREEIEGGMIARLVKTRGTWSRLTHYAEIWSVVSDFGCAKQDAFLPLNSPILRASHLVL